jgi:REP element-mobilizing transposase RayT
MPVEIARVRHWLLTSTTYGTWLPGDARGFVSTVRDGDGPRVWHNASGTPYDEDMPGLRQSARQLLAGNPVLLSADQAAVILGQFRETAGYRGWPIFAAAVMANHFHAVLSAPEDVHSMAIPRDLKSYAARALNRQWERPRSGTWWTESGSRRPLPNETAVRAAVRYVTDQYQPLAVWVADEHAPERG